MRRTKLCAALLGLTILLSTTACTPKLGWFSGKTHGPIIEVGAARASLGIYRVPRKALYSYYRARGIREAANAIWAAGRPPLTTLRVAGKTISTNYLAYKWHGYIFGDLDDLRGALVDAQKNLDCLALTLISHGVYNKNWTHKSVGCKTGQLS